MSSGHRDYDYLEWIARLTSHIPERGTQLVHYYGAYSNAHRGIAFRRETFIEVPPEDDPSDPPRPDSPRLAACRKSWARLIRRVYEVDPFLCRSTWCARFVTPRRRGGVKPVAGSAR